MVREEGGRSFSRSSHHWDTPHKHSTLAGASCYVRHYELNSCITGHDSNLFFNKGKSQTVVDKITIQEKIV